MAEYLPDIIGLKCLSLGLELNFFPHARILEPFSYKLRVTATWIIAILMLTGCTRDILRLWLTEHHLAVSKNDVKASFKGPVWKMWWLEAMQTQVAIMNRCYILHYAFVSSTIKKPFCFLILYQKILFILAHFNGLLLTKAIAKIWIPVQRMAEWCNKTRPWRHRPCPCGEVKPLKRRRILPNPHRATKSFHGQIKEIRPRLNTIPN